MKLVNVPTTTGANFTLFRFDPRVTDLLHVNVSTDFYSDGNSVWRKFRQLISPTLTRLSMLSFNVCFATLKISQSILDIDERCVCREEIFPFVEGASKADSYKLYESLSDLVI